jgi:hypothetical protein
MTTYDSYKGVSLDKLAEDVKWWEYCNGGCAMSLSNRLWEIHEETRWVSVEERLPTSQDTDEYGFVEVFWRDESNGDTRQPANFINKKLMSHWRRINPPEEP